MAKVTGPLLSLTASGQIGGSQVYAKWRGVPYVRSKVTPANPKTAGQVSTRTVFSFLSNVWKLLDPNAQAPWTAAAKGQPKTNRNMFMGTNIKGLRTPTTLDALVMSPGANGGLAAAAQTLTGGSGSITAAMTAPAIPAGWAVAAAWLNVIKQGDPHSDAVYNSVTETDVSSPYAPAATGLAAGIYVGTMWFTYTKPDGSTAYGPSVALEATAT